MHSTFNFFNEFLIKFRKNSDNRNNLTNKLIKKINGKKVSPINNA